jgi:hypothetical protein
MWMKITRGFSVASLVNTTLLFSATVMWLKSYLQPLCTWLKSYITARVVEYLFPQWVAEESSCKIFPMREIHFSDHHARTNELFRRVKRV